ncbi:MAG: hypothetical protein IJS30_07545 [Bacteroidales bacterium]|nr:hypothetical protein [Bacteroidales bacterium]
MKELFLLLALTFNPSGQYYSDADYRDLWAMVDAALEAGRPQTAVNYLNQLEQLAASKRDTLEQYQVMRKKYESLTRYNWKEANKYYPGYIQLHNELMENLDHYIERYAAHPRAGALVYEKIMRIKRNEDSALKPSAESYLKIRRMCTLAAESYPKNAKEFLSVIEQMDARQVGIRVSEESGSVNFVYPGEAVTFELSGRNVASSEFTVYRLDDRYEQAGGLTGEIVSAKGEQCHKQSITNYRNEYNIYETVKEKYTFVKPGIYVVFNSSGTDSSYLRLYVGSVALATREMGGNNQVYIADARTGQPFGNATVYACVQGTKAEDSEVLFKPAILSHKTYNLSGFTTLSQQLFPRKGRSAMIYAEHASDSWSPAVDVNSPDIIKKSRSAVVVHYLYTDRKLYRAGDTIQFKLIALSTNYEEGKVLPGKKIDVSLYAPAADKPIATLNLTTNQMGSAAGKFTIPEGNKNGRYRIATDRGSVTVDVEAYKDPKYKVEFEQIEGAYTFDDVLQQKGRVLGYTGEPVAGARVEYSVESWQYRTGQAVLAQGEALTDADGLFEISFAVPAPENDQVSVRVCSVKVKAVAPNGETCERSKSVSVARDAILFDVEFDNQYRMDTLLLVNKEKAASVTVTASNSDGVKLDTTGKYRLLKDDRTVLKGSIRYGAPLTIDFSNLPSGNYVLECMAAAGKAEKRTKTEFVLFSPDERECPVDTRLFFYPVESTGTVDFVVGSSEEIYLELELFSDGVAVYRKPLHLNGSAERIKLNYQDRWADRVSVSLFGFKDMGTVSHSHEFEREVPSANFEIKVNSLRDKTTPNTKESFTVEAPASEMLISVYDVTSDRYGKNDFWFNPIHPRYSQVPYVRSNLNDYRLYSDGVVRIGATRMMMSKGAVAEEAMVMNSAMTADDGVMLDSEDADMGTPMPDIEVREDFNQTLAFIPQLQVSGDGGTTVEFTTRDGLSAFRIAMLAHTKDLHSGTAERYIIVNKPVKIETNLPLFAIEGDRLVINASVTNTSRESITGLARIIITDEDTSKQIEVDKPEKEVMLGSGGSGITSWEVKIPEGIRRMGVTVSLAADKGTDAEKHVVEILPASRKITEAESFIVGSGITKENCISELIERLNYPDITIRYEEYSTREALIEVLRKPEAPASDNMIQWLDALYVNQMRGCLLADDSIDDRFSRRAVNKLASMQRSDGGFGWFPGNSSSDLLTLMFLDKTYYMREVGKLPVNTSIDRQIEKALGYVEKRILEIGAAKRWNWRDLTYLFAARMEHPGYPMGSQAQGILKEYLKRCKKDWQDIPVAEKAKLCMVLKGAGENARLITVMQSLRDYAVINNTVGCYFPNAVMPFRGMLHTEIYAHATLAAVFAEMDQMDIAWGIMKWLLLQKHNQQWESNMASADAIYVLIRYKAPDVKFGAVYATYTAPMLEVQPASNQMSVVRTWWRNGEQLRDGQMLRVGDKVEVRYKIDNTENRSFVVMEASRPACFYSVDERSYGSNWFYCERKAESTKYYFQVLAEEDTNLSESFFVTQAGAFNSGLVEIESLYAPEYRGHTGAIMVESKAD